MTKFKLLLIAAMAMLSVAQNANAATGQGACQLQASQEIGKWPFAIEYDYKKPEWIADKSAADLLTSQAQYFSGKNSPFMHNKIPTELGFYEAHVRFEIQPYVTYTKTIDGRTCAQIVGAKLVIHHAPQIKLARELAERNCVSRSALSQQLKHNDATIATIKELMAAPQDAKADIFPTYEKQGAAGKTAIEIAQQLVVMQTAATAALENDFTLKLRSARLQSVETRDNFTELYSSCEGEFEKASSLAKRAEAH